MSREGFERALAAMIADPELVVTVRSGDDRPLDAFELEPQDRRRLRAMAADDRMAVNCSLYRSNRLTALVRTVPELVDALGAGLRASATEFWITTPRRDLQFVSEGRSFAEFVRERHADDPALRAAARRATRELADRYELR